MSELPPDDPFESFSLAESRRFVFHEMKTCFVCSGPRPVFKDLEQSGIRMEYTVIHPCKACIISDTRNYYIPKLLEAYSEGDGGAISVILERVKEKLGDQEGEKLVKDAAHLHVNGSDFEPEGYDADDN